MKKKLGKALSLLLALVMVLGLLPTSGSAVYVTYKSTITLIPGGASPTGTKMSVGDCINGHWYVKSISTSSVTFGSPYGEHNNSFQIPDPGAIWEGVTYDYTTTVSGSAFFNEPHVGANGHIIYTAGKATYRNMKPASSSGGGVTDPGTTNPPGSSSGSSGSGSHTFYTQVVYVTKDRSSFSYGNKYSLQSNVKYDYGYTLSRSQFTPQAWGITTPAGYTFTAWQIGTPDNYNLKGNWWTVDQPGNTTDLYSTQPYQSTVIFTGSNNTVYLVYVANQDPVKYSYILNWEYNGGNLNGNESNRQTKLNVSESTATFYEDAFAEPTRTGYTFTGWEYTGNGSFNSSNGQINMTGEANKTVTGTLTAQWSANPTTTHTLTYDANGGENPPASVTGAPGDKITIADKGEMTKDGYTFVGWSLNPDAAADEADIHPGDEWTLNGDVTLYAVWRENPKTASYTVEWVDTEGNKLAEPETRGPVSVGSSVTVFSGDKKNIPSYTYREDLSTTSAPVKADGTTRLTLVYARNNPKLTGITKELVSPATPITVKKGESVTLRYRITVTGNEGANYVVSDPDAMLENGSSWTGTLGSSGRAEIYVTKTVSYDAAGTYTVTNTAYVKPGASTDPIDPDDPEGEKGNVRQYRIYTGTDRDQ